jgi:hypothetical protein
VVLIWAEWQDKNQPKFMALIENSEKTALFVINFKMHIEFHLVFFILLASYLHRV